MHARTRTHAHTHTHTHTHTTSHITAHYSAISNLTPSLQNIRVEKCNAVSDGKVRNMYFYLTKNAKKKDARSIHSSADYSM